MKNPSLAGWIADRISIPVFKTLSWKLSLVMQESLFLCFSFIKGLFASPPEEFGNLTRLKLKHLKSTKKWNPENPWKNHPSVTMTLGVPKCRFSYFPGLGKPPPPACAISTKISHERQVTDAADAIKCQGVEPDVGGGWLKSQFGPFFKRIEIHPAKKGGSEFLVYLIFLEFSKKIWGVVLELSDI